MKNESIQKIDLIARIDTKLKDHNFTKKTIETIFDATLNVISEILSDDAVKKLKEENARLQIRLYGIGSLSVKKVSARKYCLPAGTLDKNASSIIEKEESLAVHFTPNVVLKRKVNKK